MGEIHVRVPRVRSCQCLPEPLDENDDPIDLRYSECSIENLLPNRMTPEVAYLCAKHGACSTYRVAAQTVADITGSKCLSHVTVRNETLACGEYIEDVLLKYGWTAGQRKRNGAKHLRLSIDGTYITAVPGEDTSKFEVIAGRVERENEMGKRFVCALPRRQITSLLVSAALEHSGWTKSTVVDVVTDGAKGMRSLVTAVAPRVAPRMLDWFHLSMKLQAVKTPICATTYYPIERPQFMGQCERLWCKARNALWRGKGDKAIEIVRTLIASLQEEFPHLPKYYRQCAETAHGAAGALLKFLVNNREDIVDYQRARMSGRRISSASAESVMNHVVNRRLSKRQQMRWSVKGAHCLLQTRVAFLDGQLERHFQERFPHFRSPESSC